MGQGLLGRDVQISADERAAESKSMGAIQRLGFWAVEGVKDEKKRSKLDISLGCNHMVLMMGFLVVEWRWDKKVLANLDFHLIFQHFFYDSFGM